MKPKRALKERARSAGHTRSVVVIDDHPVVRVGIARLLESQKDLSLVAEAANADDGLEAVRRHNPNLAIVDISLPQADGIDLIKQLRAEFPSLAILVLSIHDEKIYASRVLRAGAQGYLMKTAGGDLLEAIENVLRGRTVRSDGLKDGHRDGSSAAPDEIREPALVQRLTDRELEVFRLIGDGVSTRNIAARLQVSVKTVESYREALKAKLNARNTGELVQRAVQWGVSHKP